MAKNVGKLLAAEVQKRRSPLYRWLQDHYDQIAPIIATQSRPSWEALARTAKASGQTGPVDGGPSRQTIRKAWLRLALDMERAAKTVPRTSEQGKRQIERVPLPLPAAATAAPERHDTQPRERKRMILRSPTPLVEGEPAKNDGSTLPAPLRPEGKF
jgi:hypothetical protein